MHNSIATSSKLILTEGPQAVTTVSGGGQLNRQNSNLRKKMKPYKSN